MLFKPLFIIHVVKGDFKSYNVVQKRSISITKVYMAHACRSFLKILGF